MKGGVHINKILCCMMVSFWLLLCGCQQQVVLQPLKDMSNQLELMVKNGESLEFYANPSYSFELPVTEELLSVMAIGTWQTVDKPGSFNSEYMLYFDLTTAEDGTQTRVALLSDGYILVQPYDSKGFGEAVWYLPKNREAVILESVITYIDAQSNLK